MAISILHNFLQQPDFNYAKGVELYNEYGYNSALKYLFSTGETEYNRSKLRAELRNLLGKANGVETPTVKSTTPIIATKKEPINVHELPQELRVLNTHKGELYNVMAYNHRELTIVNSDKERADLLARIKQNHNEIKDIWNQLDHWQKTKTFLRNPEPIAEVPPIDRNELLRQLLNVRTNISKLKKNAKRADDLAKLEAKKLELEILLKP